MQAKIVQQQQQQQQQQTQQQQQEVVVVAQQQPQQLEVLVGEQGLAVVHRRLTLQVLSRLKS